MKIEIEIDELDLKNEVIKRLADQVFNQIWNPDIKEYKDWKDRDAQTAKLRQEILAKIDWKNAGAQLSETVVQKFFMNLLDKR